MHDTKPQLFIMDEWLGDPIPLAEIKEISEPTLDEEYDMPDIAHLKEGFEIPFEVKMKKSAINKLFQPCFGREPYRNLEKCAKCILKKDCIVAKIENNFNMRLRGIPPLIINHKEDTNGRERKETVETARSGTFTRSDSVCHAGV